ncbi:hypothetical protein [Candidatus Uabimicrobium amorphum]|uniref:Uncharacterized protein n=1 Tax=Uabimicrobium amorphum TaxID=2596890 RepID=A0A5S9F7C2_UABAM|nr:hypothetical protein [Candidatus Uabimicrobium amorphum]BBM87102.1 hypothetical protein UABAM_05505 [Candidatus Uabimicrobium amorphum]
MKRIIILLMVICSVWAKDLDKPEEYAADTIDGHAGYIANKFDDESFEDWQIKYLRDSLVQWLKEESLKHVYIDVVNTDSKEVDFRTRFDIKYSKDFKSDFWRDLSKLRQDARKFSKENEGKSYKVSILVGFSKKHSSAKGWSPAKGYPGMNKFSVDRVKSHNAVSVGGINIKGSTVGITILSP